MSLEVVIYTCDNIGYHFTLPNGKSTASSQYFQLMINNLNIPEGLAKKSFALWLKSPLLDVQLKPHHIPFRMVKQWPMFLQRFSMSTDVEISQDEPALLFRRNAFLSKEDEMQITNPKILNLLKIEAKLNIRKGLYPCDVEDIEQLGAMLCFENHERAHDENLKLDDILKENLASLVPSHMAKPRKSIFRRQQSIEDRIVHCANLVSAEPSLDPLLEFMKICWQLPYYGSVIFNGIVERAQHNINFLGLIGQTELCVIVAINTSGVWVIDAEKKHVLIGLLYDQFNWEFTEGVMGSDGAVETISSLYLEFDAEDGSSRLLQIVSKEAPMMNSMIETCNVMALESQQIEQAKKLKPVDTVDGDVTMHKFVTAATSSRVRPLVQRQNSVTNNRTEKLNLTPIVDDVTSQECPKPDEERSNNKTTTKKMNLLKKLKSKSSDDHVVAEPLMD